LGHPMSHSVHMSAPDLDDSDIDAVVRVLRSGRLALGQRAVEFERIVADYVGVEHAVAVSSGTAALHLAAIALGIGPGDEVLVPSFTFAASLNAILYQGARPVFVDIDPDTYNLSPADLEKKITDRTKAIMAVDVFGHPVDWAQIESIARSHDLRVIDDSCEALGAEYRGTKVGRFGDAATFAFYPNKQLTTGEGGMLVTDDPRIASLARSLRNQGRGEMGAWLDHDRLGYNYRMDEMSAALGASQMARLELFLTKRENVACLYTERLEAVGRVRAPIVRPQVRMSWFVYVVTLESDLDRNAIMLEVESHGIPVRGYFSPMHLQPYVRQLLDVDTECLPVTEDIARRTIALPFHNNLTLDEIDRVVNTLREVLH